MGCWLTWLPGRPGCWPGGSSSVRGNYKPGLYPERYRWLTIRLAERIVKAPGTSPPGNTPQESTHANRVRSRIDASCDGIERTNIETPATLADMVQADRQLLACTTTAELAQWRASHAC